MTGCHYCSLTFINDGESDRTRHETDEHLDAMILDEILAGAPEQLKVVARFHAGKLLARLETLMRAEREGTHLDETN